jgi:HSP20 family protein
MATLVRFRELGTLQNEMNRLMSGLLEGGNGRSRQAWAPAVDVWETDDELVYSFDLPGIPQDEIKVELKDGALTVSAERERTDEVKKDRFYRFERRFGSFSRTIALPQGTTDESIKGQLQGRRARGSRREAQAAEAAPHRDRRRERAGHDRGLGDAVVASK